ncbi:MAG: hypothetical protein F4X13_07965 [Gammaproteobacteria bacterium]|nr:hypothetical protein [Gammaproteobacteria bacterium]
MARHWRKLAALLLAAACSGDATAPPNPTTWDASGTWREARALPPMSIARDGMSGADAASSDSVVYTLRIYDLGGFIHGTWAIQGDASLPVDPWEAIVVGNHSDGAMLTEYTDPRYGRCRLHGAVDSVAYRPERRCEGSSWDVAESFVLRLVDAPPDSSTATIHVAVIVEDEGLPGIRVTLSGADRRTATTDGYGLTSFSGLPAGDYLVAIDGYDPHDYEFAFTSENVRVEPGETATVAFVGVPLGTSGVAGRVSGEGMGLAGVTVTLSGAVDASTTTDADGQYSFGGLAAGTYFVRISDYPEDVSFETVSVEVEVEVGEVGSADFTGHFIRTSAVEGQVVIEGEGLAGVTVTLSGGPADESYTTMTDANGMYRFEELRPGDYTVSISGFDTRSYEFAATSQDVSMDLDETVTVSFTGVRVG